MAEILHKSLTLQMFKISSYYFKEIKVNTDQSTVNLELNQRFKDHHKM